MVESTNTNPKTRIDVMWVAPDKPGSGCILIRTTLLQHRDVWYMDDGGLTRSICEESTDEVESAPLSENQNKCCACDEARYELTFKSTWSRNHHPKDFPTKGWITRFSDIIGASHTEDYRFWEYAQLASQGMKEFAEHGAAQTLEREFSYNFKKGKIRTIIKARGPAFPNLNGQSVASIRADPQHHLLSLASKIDPSPDWIVGVSGLELCMSNCTWLERKTVTLYPWDVGTDAGPSYTSPDQPQIPAAVIQRMRSDMPNDPRSPFFDDKGGKMKPLAILDIKRQRLYERLCEDEESNNLDVPRECFTHPWTAWTECTSKCGEGRQFRTRVYKQPDLADIFKCEVETRQDRNCMGEECGRTERRLNRMRDRDRYGEYDFDKVEKNEDLDGGNDEAKDEEEEEDNEDDTEAEEENEDDKDDAKTARNENEMEEEQEKLEQPGFSNRQQGRSRNRYGYRRPINAEDQETENKDENEEGEEVQEEDEAEDEKDADEEEEDANNEKNTFVNRYNYNNRYNLGGRRKGASNELRTDEQVGINEDDDTDNRSPGRFGNSNRYNGGGRRRNDEIDEDEEEEDKEEEEEEEEEDVGRTKGRGRNRRPDARRNPNDNEESENKQAKIPYYCLQSIKIYNCPKKIALKNYWFYNYCEDICMLFTADKCDRNRNKFTSLESCEETCRPPGSEFLLRRKQKQSCYKPNALRQHKSRYLGIS
ncbi:spondin-1-like isoform X3 [Bactrocera oleae]